MEAAYPEFLLRHFSLMRREDKEDIVLDYLLRFNMFIEQHYKKFVMLLSNDEESSKTLGSLHLKLGMNGKFLTELRRIRNAISHGTCVISIDDGDILHSKIDFHYETRAGNRLVIKRVTKAWGELVDHLEKIYDIVLGLDRRVKYFLVQKKMINDDGGIIDAPSKEFLAFFSKK